MKWGRTMSSQAWVHKEGKSYLCWQYGSLLHSEASLQQHLKEPIGWLGFGDLL